MTPEELKSALEVMTKGLEGKTSIEIKGAIDAFTKSNKEEIDLAVKSVQDELQVKLDAVQAHANKLDVKMKEKSIESKRSVDNIKSAIVENGENIIKVKKGNVVEVKAVGDMSTANLTGDEPRTQNFDIVKFPSQKVNVSDIVGSVNIDGGTYTYTVEGAGEGSIGAQTENATKNQRDYDFTNVDVTTDFIAGFARYSRKMVNNLSYITSAIPQLLRRDYFKAENAAFNTVLVAQATVSTELITDSSKIEMLMNDISKLEDLDYDTNGIVIRPSDYMDMLKAAKDDLQSAVTYEAGVLRVAGVQIFKATWVTANKYFVGDWSRVNKINTEGLSLEFSDSEGTNFVKNMITARIESQTAIVIEQPLAVVLGDFTATA
tara:strand:+ start:1253 stop:2380 length:1128 start_codon:yes stop_codon:yes gene_type:complete